MSGESSLRNAVKRITHKERAQPSNRQRFGLLEKHGDYVERARDYKNKQNYLKNLRKKAAERNPDEFYFKMNSSRVKNGVHEKVENKSLDTDTVRLLKTQDAGYIAHKKTIDDRKIEKLRENLHFIGETRPGAHKIFVDTEDDVSNFDLASHLDTLPELVDRTYNIPTKRTLEKISETCVSDDLKSSSVRSKYAELTARTNRSEKLGTVLNELHLQKALMGKGSKRKLTVKDADGKEKTVFKWKRQRSK